MPTSPAVQHMIDYVTNLCDPVDMEQRFRDMLDECYSFEDVGGPFASMTPSRVLEEIDPIAFRCGVSDYSGDETLIEIDGDYYDKEEVVEAVEEYIDTLRDELTDAEDDASEDSDEDEDDTIVEGLRQQIEACEKHAW